MEAGRARNRGNPPFRLSLGLTSVRNIVDRLEAECASGVLNSGLEVIKYQDCSEEYSAVLSGLEVVKFDPNVASDDDFTFATSNGKVASKLALGIALALSRCVPSVTLANFGVLSVATGLVAPRMMSYLVLYPFCRLVFGTLYPAYASYKAVRTKNLKEYVKWMMYWIVFALFTCTETFTDVFLSWFPFYYEVKIVLVLWLLSPATKGSSILYRKFVHPALCRREQEIDEYIAKAKDQGYHTVLNLGTKGVNYATTVIMQTAIKGGGGLVQQLRKSYSLSDLTECEPREERGADEADDVLAEPRLIRRAVKSSYAARRSASESNSRQPIYFPEVDVDVRSTRSSRSDEPDFSHIKSTEDISSGYSSADNSACLTRAGSVGAAGRARARTPRTAVTTVKRPPAAEDNEVFIEELQDDDLDNYSDMPSLVNVSCLYLSHTNPPFIYQYVGDQVKIIKVLGQLPLDDEANPKSTVTIQEGQTDNRNKESSNNTVNKQTDEINKKHEMSSNILGSPEYSNVDENKLNAEKSLSHDQNNATKVDEKCFEHIETKDDVKDGSADVVKVSSGIENNSKINMQVKQISEDVETKSVTETFEETLSDNYSSDDEASYGTPNDSPNTTRKLVKGKYGKNKAPLPPVVDKVVQQIDVTDSVKETSKEENKLNLESSATQNINQSISTDNLFPEDTSKIRQKSKSPIRVPKPGASGLGKLLQLPSKFAFWHKPDEKPLSDDISMSSGEQSRRTSADDLEKRSVDSDLNSKVFESIIDVPLKDNSTTEITETRDTDKESTQNIIDKSDVLQKLIEAKLESHPEYKFVPLSADNEIQTASKSTDV